MTSKPVDHVWEDLREEWGLLHDVMMTRGRDPRAELGALASYYQQRGAWDAYASVRMRMLEVATMHWIPGAPAAPAPGGPFPRIGASRETAPPATLLGRWLNARDLPELYQSPEVTPSALVRQLNGEWDRAMQTREERADLHELELRLGDAMCVQLDFENASSFYRRALAGGNQRAAGRLDDLARLLRSP